MNDNVVPFDIIVEYFFLMQIAKTIHKLINYIEPMLRTRNCDSCILAADYILQSIRKSFETFISMILGNKEWLFFDIYAIQSRQIDVGINTSLNTLPLFQLL